MMSVFVSFGMTCLLTCTQLLGGELVWEKDYHKAIQASVRENRPLLLFFTGSDCSGWGMKLKNEILADSDFIEKTKDHFVFVEIDFPEHKAVDPIIAEQNRQLKESWKVTEIPRLILVENGREIGRFGSTSLEPSEFADDLLAIMQKNQQLTQLMSQIETLPSNKLEDLYRLARELERESEAQKILEAGYVRELSFFLIEKYRFLVEAGKSEEFEAKNIKAKLLARDPNNQKKIPLSLALIDFQKQSLENVHKAIAIKPLVEYLAKFGNEDKENRWRLEMMIAQFYLDSDEWQKALVYAEAAYGSAPEPRKEEIARSLHYIRGEAVIADN